MSFEISSSSDGLVIDPTWVGRIKKTPSRSQLADEPAVT